ncbi:MAG: sigma-70 family RNA polymerase sigma factor [Clostridia bacterium]|nr:sigma-70 family RNA polymerase sigma factor [Clostridia bacterium]
MIEEKNISDSLVENNLGLVHSCANRFRGRGIEYDDLYQAGCLGLVKASKNYDETKGFAFSTYAVPVILGEIKRLFRDGGTVKIGRALKEKSRIAVRKRDEISVVLGREPTVTELAESMNIDPTEAAMLLNASSPVMSLTSGEDGEIQFDLPVESHENDLSDTIALNQILDSLESKDKKLIMLRYYKNLTQSATAKLLGMTQVQVSRREKAILEIMRRKMDL